MRSSLCVALIIVVGIPTALLHGQAPAGQRGVILHKKLPEGEWLQYVPAQNPTSVLVVVHGTPDPGQDIPKLAATFLKRWAVFAETNRLVAVAPIFDDDFGSSDEASKSLYGGYRGLIGKHVGADEFVHQIVDQYKGKIAGFDGRFYLYGHSAGGQFGVRYAVRHPERLLAAVLSAPGRYAFPDPEVRWPYGQKETTVKADWLAKPLSIQPDPDGWRKAAMLPITVVIGAADTSPQPTRPGHMGKTRVEFAQQWVEAMTALAPQGKSGVRLAIVPNIGHNSASLTPLCQRALAEYVVRRRIP